MAIMKSASSSTGAATTVVSGAAPTVSSPSGLTRRQSDAGRLGRLSIDPAELIVRTGFRLTAANSGAPRFARIERHEYLSDSVRVLLVLLGHRAEATFLEDAD